MVGIAMASVEPIIDCSEDLGAPGAATLADVDHGSRGAGVQGEPQHDTPQPAKERIKRVAARHAERKQL